MQSSHLSKYASNKWVRVTVYLITCLFRLTVGGIFIFSGFVKAIDPWGTYYKFQEYFAALGIPGIYGFILFCVFTLIFIEFLIGVCLLTGSYRKATPIFTVLFMCVMLPLTLWVAVSNPVADCGCFGDFWIISNWATFWKNVALTIMAIWLVFFNKRVVAIITPALQWIQIVFTFVFIMSISFWGFFEQPLLDFRPYAEGKEIASENEDNEGEYYTFVYEKDGVEKEFNINDTLPSEDEGWKFKERKINSSKVNSNSELSKPESENTLRIWDKSGEEDMTEAVFDGEGEMLILLMPELDKVSPATTWKINSLYDAASNSGVTMFAIVSGSPEMISEWEDLSMPQYEIFTADDTVIKEIARGNPALVFVKNNIIEWKSSLSTLNIDEITKDNHLNTSYFVRDDVTLLRNMIYMYLICMAVLIGLSFFPKLRNVGLRKKFISDKESIHDDKALHEE